MLTGASGHDAPVSPVDENSVRPSIAACSRIASPGTSIPSVSTAFALPTFSHSPKDALAWSGPLRSFAQPAIAARMSVSVLWCAK